MRVILPSNLKNSEIAARSPVFASMIDRMSKEDSSEITIEEGVSEEAMESVLNFLYTGRTNLPSSPDFCESYLEIAERFGLSDLKTACFAHLALNLNDENAGHVALLAFKFNADGAARERILSYCQQ